MDYQLEHGLEILARTPATLDSLVVGLSDPWLTANEGPDTWTPWDIIAHLTSLERTDWIPRVRIIMEHGRDRPFDSVDRTAFRAQFDGRSVESMVEEFGSLRRGNVDALRSLALTPDQLELPGAHPSFGDVILSQLLAAWVVHDLTHTAQIVRVMAKQYDSAVGPWKEYLTLLNR